MDYITACYYSDMRLYKDRPDVLTRGKWRWCPPDAKPVPYKHLFGSFTNDFDGAEEEPALGEVPIKQGRTRGEANPRYTGQRVCGHEGAWTQGAVFAQKGSVEVDEEGVPLCCQAGEAGPGGQEENGTANVGGPEVPTEMGMVFSATKGYLGIWMTALASRPVPRRLYFNPTDPQTPGASKPLDYDASDGMWKFSGSFGGCTSPTGLKIAVSWNDGIGEWEALFKNAVGPGFSPAAQDSYVTEPFRIGFVLPSGICLPHAPGAVGYVFTEA